jgi:hypothetical protein
MNSLGFPTNKREFFQLMYRRFVQRIESVPLAYRGIFQFLAEEKVREYIPRWQDEI